MGYVVAALTVSLIGVGVWAALWIGRLKDRERALVEELGAREKVLHEAQARAGVLEGEKLRLDEQRKAALKAFEDLSDAVAKGDDSAEAIANRLRRQFP